MNFVAELKSAGLYYLKSEWTDGLVHTRKLLPTFYQQQYTEGCLKEEKSYMYKKKTRLFYTGQGTYIIECSDFNNLISETHLWMPNLILRHVYKKRFSFILSHFFLI
jgi:hypothetical protein